MGKNSRVERVEHVEMGGMGSRVERVEHVEGVGWSSEFRVRSFQIFKNELFKFE